MKFLLLIFFFCRIEAERVKYDNYQVYRVITMNKSEIFALRDMFSGGIITDFWKFNWEFNSTSDVVVPIHKISHFNEVMKENNIKYHLNIPNIQELINKANAEAVVCKNLCWTSFHRASKINDWMKELSIRYPKQIKLIVAGYSYEGRNITGVKLSFKVGNKGVFFEGGIHGREWMSPAVVTFFLNLLLKSKNLYVREIAESYDWYFFPLFNPDGYEYTFNKDRLWRLTRQPHGICTGADANRNWEYFWHVGDYANKACSENYVGPRPFSEPETFALSKFIKGIHKNLMAYFAIRSYGQLLLIPFSYSTHSISNLRELLDIGRRGADAIRKRFDSAYKVRSWTLIRYPMSGTSTDWIKGTFKIPITYTLLLRDNPKFGLIPPASEIIPTASETADGILTMLIEAKHFGYNN